MYLLNRRKAVFVLAWQPGQKVHPKASILQEIFARCCCIFTTPGRQNYTLKIPYLSIGRFPSCCTLSYMVVGPGPGLAAKIFVYLVRLAGVYWRSPLLLALNHGNQENPHF